MKGEESDVGLHSNSTGKSVYGTNRSNYKSSNNSNGDSKSNSNSKSKAQGLNSPATVLIPGN